MDAALATLQGLGLALAAGFVTGAVAGPLREGARAPLLLLLALAAIGGAYLFGASLASEDHPAWPGWPLGTAAALLTFGVVRGLVAGALGRGREQASPIVLAGAVVLAGGAIGGLSVLLPPLSLLAFAALALLACGRRRRAAQKYEGLRSLR